MSDVRKWIVNDRVISIEQQAESNGSRPEGHVDRLERLYYQGRFKEYYDLLRKGRDRSYGVKQEVLATFQIVRREPYNKDRYKLLNHIVSMPVGKRKLIILHKRAHELYTGLQNANYRTHADLLRMAKLDRLMVDLKFKINYNE